MFNEVGGKLKGFAIFNVVYTVIITVLGLVDIFLLADTLRLSGGEIVLSVVCLALLVVFMMGACWVIYAFGEVTERTTGIDRKLADTNKTLKETKELLRKAFVDSVAETERKEKAQAEAEEAARTEQSRIRAELDRQKAEAVRAKQAEKQRRYDEYWAAHAEERTALEVKRHEAYTALKALNKGSRSEREKLNKLIDSIDLELKRER